MGPVALATPVPPTHAEMTRKRRPRPLSREPPSAPRFSTAPMQASRASPIRVLSRLAGAMERLRPPVEAPRLFHARAGLGPTIPTV